MTRESENSNMVVDIFFKRGIRVIMRRGTSNTKLVWIILLCLAAAIGLTYAVHFSNKSRHVTGIESIPEDETVLMMCEDPNCGYVFEMNKRRYYRLMEAKPIIGELGEGKPPALVCEQCGSETAYRAVRCEKCGKIFFRGTVPNDFADRCPDPNCGYSRIEEMRRKAALERKSAGDEQGGGDDNRTF